MRRKTLAIALAATTTFILASPALATECATVRFSGGTQQPAPKLPFIGEMELVNLVSGEHHYASVATMLLGAVSADGLEVVTSHEISGGREPGVDFVTFDDARLVPTATPGTFSLISRMVVKSGQGAFNCGEMLVDSQASTISFDAEGLGSSEFQGFGRLCRCKPSDN